MVIRINVDNFDEAHDLLASHGFKDGARILDVKTAKSMGMISPSGFIIGLVVVVDKLLHPQVEAGWTSMFATMLFIGGFIMIFLGLIGEYVGRGYLISNHIPQYIIREEVRKEGKK